MNERFVKTELLNEVFRIFKWFIPVVCESNIKYQKDIWWVRQTQQLLCLTYPPDIFLVFDMVFRIMKSHILVTVYNRSEVTYCPRLCVTSLTLSPC